MFLARLFTKSSNHEWKISKLCYWFSEPVHWIAKPVYWITRIVYLFTEPVCLFYKLVYWITKPDHWLLNIVYWFTKRVYWFTNIVYLFSIHCLRKSYVQDLHTSVIATTSETKLEAIPSRHITYVREEIASPAFSRESAWRGFAMTDTFLRKSYGNRNHYTTTITSSISHTTHSHFLCLTVIPKRLLILFVLFM